MNPRTILRETTEKVDKEKTCRWLSRGDLKVQTATLLCAAQEQVLYEVPHR